MLRRSLQRKKAFRRYGRERQRRSSCSTRKERKQHEINRGSDHNVIWTIREPGALFWPRRQASELAWQCYPLGMRVGGAVLRIAEGGPETGPLMSLDMTMMSSTIVNMAVQRRGDRPFLGRYSTSSLALSQRERQVPNIHASQ